MYLVGRYFILAKFCKIFSELVVLKVVFSYLPSWIKIFLKYTIKKEKNHKKKPPTRKREQNYIYYKSLSSSGSKS